MSLATFVSLISLAPAVISLFKKTKEIVKPSHPPLDSTWPMDLRKKYETKESRTTYDRVLFWANGKPLPAVMAADPKSRTALVHPLSSDARSYAFHVATKDCDCASPLLRIESEGHAFEAGQVVRRPIHWPLVLVKDVEILGE